MRTRRNLLVLAAAALASLAMVGVSAAVEGTDPPPVEEAPHGAAVSAAARACPTGPEHGPCVSTVASSKASEGTEAEEPEAEAPEAAEVEVEVEVDDDGEGGPPEDTHGFAVSTAAKECPEGPEHGPCVSAVARSKAGQAGDSGERRGGPPEGTPGAQGNGDGKGGPPAGVGGGRP